MGRRITQSNDLGALLDTLSDASVDVGEWRYRHGTANRGYRESRAKVAAALLAVRRHVEALEERLTELVLRVEEPAL